MLTGITTRTSTPQEDAEPWPGGSARPVLACLTGTLGMAAARCPVDESTHPRRHVIVVRHAAGHPTFSVHEVAHNRVEWVGGQGHYDLGYADALRRMAGKAVGQA